MERQKKHPNLLAGRYKPGESGNPGGPPRNILKRIREEYGADVPAVVGALRDLALGRAPKGYESVEIKTSDRVKAATEFLDRLGITPQRQLTLTHEQPPAVVDMTKLTEEQLEALAAIEFVEAESPPDDATEH